MGLWFLLKCLIFLAQFFLFFSDHFLLYFFESLQSFLPQSLINLPFILHSISVFLNLVFFLIIFIIKIEFLFTFRAEMITVLDDPLSETFVMEKMFTGKQSGLSHVLETNHASVIMMFFNLLLIYFFEVFHCISQFLDSVVWSNNQ